ncbi:MAG: exodeoxyribonuclease V subunit gamma [Halochromatium sp.]
MTSIRHLSQPEGPLTSDWPTGFMLIQGNRLEALRQLLTTWLSRHPLHPLENEVILVQSNGIGQWLRLALAEQPLEQPGGQARDGIAAALDLMLPGRFLWQAYRAVLGDLPERSAYDKAPLGWRLYRLLGKLDALADTAEERTHLAPLRGFLDADPEHDGAARRRYQLAVRLADLYDQYQVYRADWLEAWLQGQDQVIDAHGTAVELPQDQRWQPLLWRRLKQDLIPTEQGNADDPLALPPGSDPPPGFWISRAQIHQRFLAQAKTLDPAQRPPRLPRRVIVFGISSLPRQTIDALEALAKVSQVMLFVHNPSRHYWGDLVEGRELFRQAYRRDAQRGQRKIPGGLDEQALHLYGHPLLAAWGKQGRDYIRLLDEHDERGRYEERFQQHGLQIDLFESPLEADAPDSASLLQQLQDDILELRPLHERRAQASAIDPHTDRSLSFLVAHSPQREVEILHDQLLDAFAAAEQAGQPLAPREILVMVPDIDRYAPHIEAVFGRFAPDDRRRIPFQLSDQAERQRNPLLIGLESLLKLPQSRLALGDLLDLLEIPALRARFGLQETDLPQLRQWVIGANVRWGLDAAHRAGLGLPPDLEQNSWLFGLRRMLLGFAAGDSAPWQGIEPYAEVGGLDAALVGPLAELLQTLAHHWAQLKTPRPPTQWGELLAALLDACFCAETDADERILARLRDALEQWLQDVTDGGLGAEPLPLEVVRDAWLGALDEPSLSQRFLAGAVNIATLMPMRAIPFRQIWLLGMNDGDYPRSRRPADFDLMANDYRPGDRSRREDDRYLFLEALLSARERLVISWVGRSVRDNSERPPSVLVGQLRDHIAAGWRLQLPADAATTAAASSGKALLAALTTEHPLQPFSRRYFESGPADSGDSASARPASGASHQLFTYAHEWRELHQATAASDEEVAPRLAPPILEAPISLRQLGDFLRSPVQTFYRQRLGLFLQDEAEPDPDAEPFDIDALGSWGLRAQMLASIERQLATQPVSTSEDVLDAAIGRLGRSGHLPLAPFDALLREQLQSELSAPLAHYRALLSAHPETLPTAALRLEVAGWVLEDSLSGLRAAAKGEGERLRLTLQPSALIKDHQLRWQQLVRPWPAHLAAQLHAPTTSCLIGPGGALRFRPLEPDAARACLDELIQGYQQGLSELLPLACRTAFAELCAEKDMREKGKTKAKPAVDYEGQNPYTGERDEHPGYARFWPDYADLSADPRYRALIERLYQPLFDHQPEQEAF